VKQPSDGSSWESMGRKKKSQNIETFFLLRERIKRI